MATTRSKSSSAEKPSNDGDFISLSLVKELYSGDGVRNLRKFGENINGKWEFRFASHPRFPIWAFNMIQGKRFPQQTGTLLEQNPWETHLTIDERIYIQNFIVCC